MGGFLVEPPGFRGTRKHMGVSKNRGDFTPKMDGENNGKPYEQMDDLVGQPLFLETPISHLGKLGKS